MSEFKIKPLGRIGCDRTEQAYGLYRAENLMMIVFDQNFAISVQEAFDAMGRETEAYGTEKTHPHNF